MLRRVAIVGSLALWLAACGRAEEAPVQAERISLDEARNRPAEPAASPDTEEASWRVAGNGQAIHFGNAGEPPLLSLACDLREQPIRLRIIRHASARPGLKALLPVIGNGTISRFKVDATLNEGEWRWEGAVPSNDPALDVFTGRRELEATLPGAGSLLIEGSRIPGEFVTWCRAGGRNAQVEGNPPAEEPTKEEASE